MHVFFFVWKRVLVYSVRDVRYRLSIRIKYLKTSLDYLNGRIEMMIINCSENRYDKNEFRTSVRTFLYRRFVNAKNMRDKKHKLSLLRFALQEDSRLDGLSLSSSSLPTPKARNTKRQSERGTEFSSTDLRVYVTYERSDQKMHFCVSI